MDFLKLCTVLYVASGSSPVSLRVSRQVWPDSEYGPEHDHLHFPDQTVPGRAENYFNNEILGFRATMSKPQGLGNVHFGPGFRPRPSGGSSQWLSGINTQTPSEGNGQLPDFSNNPWLNGLTGQRPNGGNTQRPMSSTIPSTTTDRTSTPRTFHLAPEGCNCPSTPQFNPVCGTDGNTYKNAGLLKCFRLCGIDVSQKRMGAC